MLCNVLIIDIRKVLSTKYKKSLSDENTTVNVAYTIKDALSHIQTNEPDLIIISDSIPEELSDFCEKIRVLTYNIRPIIVALSKSDNTDDKIKVLSAGADDYISEPVNIKEFQFRIKAHLRREIETNLDTKTLLPNEKYSTRTLKRVLANKDFNWATLLINIENFKQYVELYTDFAGDKVVQTLIAIIKSSIDDTDFLSRLSENEFMIITNSTIAEKIASYLVIAFDTVAPKFYSQEDSTRGYMLLQGDDEAERRIEFLSLLISVITCEYNKFNNPEHIINQMRRIKYLAKRPAKSNYIVDRPKLSGEGSATVIQNNKIVVIEPDEALELLLKTTLELQGYDVITELTQDITPNMFIIDIDDNKINLELCKNLKTMYANSKIIATSNIHDKSAILNTGADLYLPKPYELSNLLRWVTQLID